MIEARAPSVGDSPKRGVVGRMEGRDVGSRGIQRVAGMEVVTTPGLKGHGEPCMGAW